MTAPQPPVLSDVVAAAERISSLIRTTPVLPAPDLGDGVGIKAECLQETGSFKIRGAANALLLLDRDRRRAGVVAVSSGNHGRAVAHVARCLGIPAQIVVSARVPATKVEAIRGLGAGVVVGGPGQDEAEAAARDLVDRTGATFIHPFDDPAVIAGQGTIGLEIAAAAPETVLVVVPLSGGGLISGVALALKARLPAVRVVGVSQDRGPAMHACLAAGRLVDVVEEDTLADALAGGLGPENYCTLQMCRRLVDEVVLVSEEEIAAAMKHLRHRHGLRVEGGGAVGVGALLSGAVAPAAGTVVVVSGGNVSDATWERVTA